MSASPDLLGAEDDAGFRCGAYRALSEAFSYSGSQASAFRISGADFNDAFDPSVNEAACSLREQAYTDEDQSALFEELMRFYSFFGLRRGKGAEMPDHLSVELEFMHFLTHLEREAVGRPKALMSLRCAQRDFLERHLRRLVCGVRAALVSRTPGCVSLVETVSDFIEAEVAFTKASVDT